MKKLLSRRTDERGAVLVMAIAGVILAMIAAALAVDLGRLAQLKRLDQKVADLAALDASRKLPIANDVKDAAQASARRNGPSGTVAFFGMSGPDPDGLYVCLGTFAGGNFQPGAVPPCQTGTVVRVQAQSKFVSMFPFVGDGPGGANARGVAQLAAEPEAAFSVGSTLASLDTQASALDGVLGEMLGETAAGMNVVSYDGLATGSVTLAALRTKLVGLGYTLATPNDVFTQNIQVAHLLTATSQVLADQGSSTAKAEIDKIIALGINAALMTRIGRFVSVATPATDAALDTSVNVFSLVNGAAQVANGTNFVSVPGINVSIPGGLGSISTQVSVIEPAQTARGKVGVQANTSQVRVRLRVSLLATGLLAGIASVYPLDIDYTAASAQATLTNINCASSPASIQLTPTTNATAVGLTATVNGLLPLYSGTLTANGSIAATPPPAIPPSFNYPTQFAPPVGPSPAYTVHVGAASLGFSPAPPFTVTGSGGLLISTVAGIVQTLLPTVFLAANTLVAPLLQPVLKVLGLDLAGADLMALDIIPPPPACGLPIGQPTLLK